jgi:hypothetical protein
MAKTKLNLYFEETLISSLVEDAQHLIDNQMFGRALQFMKGYSQQSKPIVLSREGNFI